MQQIGTMANGDALLVAAAWELEFAEECRRLMAKLQVLPAAPGAGSPGAKTGAALPPAATGKGGRRKPAAGKRAKAPTAGGPTTHARLVGILAGAGRVLSMGEILEALEKQGWRGTANARSAIRSVLVKFTREFTKVGTAQWMLGPDGAFKVLPAEAAMLGAAARTELQARPEELTADGLQGKAEAHRRLVAEIRATLGRAEA